MGAKRHTHPDRDHNHQMDARILIVEDDRSIRETTAIGLRQAGFTVLEAADGEEGIARVRDWRPDAIVLDVMLPKLDGLEVCRAVRRDSTVPIVMLTARSDTIDVVVGLEAGADDYITKPFEFPVLVARLRAVLRRSIANEKTELIRLGPLSIDTAGYEVMRNGDVIRLSNTEFELLATLAARPKQVFTREMLLDQVWGYDYLGDSRLVDVAVQRLRSKIEDNPAEPTLILTVRGVGYRAGHT
jgi:two-component system response regulator MtrA